MWKQETYFFDQQNYLFTSEFVFLLSNMAIISMKYIIVNERLALQKAAKIKRFFASFSLITQKVLTRFNGFLLGIA